jgi:ATP-dependent helicase YprA (DUF1998 family)
MEPLTTQTFSGDKTEDPQSAPPASGTVESGTVESGAAGDTLAVPFRDFPISDEICRGLEAAGIFTTFPIQALTLPLALRGQDIIGQARTGTGKTLAFGIPLLQMIGDGPPGSWRFRSPTTCASPRSTCAPASSPSMAAGPTSRRSTR